MLYGKRFFLLTLLALADDCGVFWDNNTYCSCTWKTRALGDWDMKFSRSTPSTLVAEPKFCQVTLTEDDEFLIMGCANRQSALCAMGLNGMMTPSNVQGSS